MNFIRGFMSGWRFPGIRYWSPAWTARFGSKAGKRARYAVAGCLDALEDFIAGFR